jgi:ketosteroid isomerase-like protein
MPDHPNATLLRSALEQMVSSGDPSSQMDLLADDVEWHEIGRDEPIRGKEALKARFSQMPEGSSITLDVHDVLANDDHTIALVTATAKMGDQSLVYRTAEIHHIRDGKITHRWAFSDDTERINRFFAPSES